MSDEFDVLIKNTTIVDGSGKKSYQGSIGVRKGKIVEVGSVKGDAATEIDAASLMALPGFINAHSHHDGLILWYPGSESYVMQGVTTFVGGQCGSSNAPLGELVHLFGRLQEYVQEIIPHKYYPEKTLFPREQINGFMKEKFGWTIDWHTMGEFLDFVESRGISMNFAPLLGHGAVRRLVLGEDYKRASKESEIRAMEEPIHQAIKDGCIGMSTGLDYDPDVFASREEINRHVSILKEYGVV